MVMQGRQLCSRLHLVYTQHMAMRQRNVVDLGNWNGHLSSYLQTTLSGEERWLMSNQSSYQWTRLLLLHGFLMDLDTVLVLTKTKKWAEKGKTIRSWQLIELKFNCAWLVYFCYSKCILTPKWCIDKLIAFSEGCHIQ